MCSAVVLSLALLQAQGSGPSVFWVSQPVKSGQTVLAYGAGLDGVKTVALEGQANGNAEVNQSSEHAVAFKLTGTGTYPVVGANISASGGSTHVWVNRPTIWWAQTPNGQEIRPGEQLEIFGTCLGTSDSKTSVTVKAGGKNWQIQPEKADLYSLQITLPKDLPTGANSLVVNRAGMDSEPSPLDITTDPPDANGGESSVSLAADGQKDDTAALQSAINQAASGNKTVTLPAGTIRVTSGLTIPSHCSLSGVQEGRTIIVFDIADKAPNALVELQPYASLSNLTIFGTNYINGVVGGGDGGGHVAVRNVRLRLDPYMGHLKPEDIGTQMTRDVSVKDGGIDSMSFRGPNVDVEGCDIDGAGVSILMDRVNDAVVRNNRLVNGRWGWYSIRISKRVIFQGNTITGGDMMSCGGGINSKFGSENIFFDHNSLDRFYGWDREGMTSDAPGGGYYGLIKSARGQDVEMPETIKGGATRWKGGALFILGGKGEGQYRIIQNVTDATATVDTPWTVEPDSTSIVSIAPIVHHILLTNNDITDTSVGIQLFGSTVDVIASGNKSTRTMGFYTAGRNYGGGIEPSWYVQWLNNTVSEPVDFLGNGVASANAHFGGIGCVAYNPRLTPAAPLIFGNVLRDNTITSDGSIHMGWSGLRSAAGDLLEDSLVEHNTIKDSPIGIHVAPCCRRVILVDNSFEGCAKTVVDERPAGAN